MAPPQVVTFPEETLQRLYKNLEDKEDLDNICELCTLPTLLHTDVQGNRIHGACTRNQDLTEDDCLKEWTQFHKRMKAVRSWYKDRRRTQDLEEKVNNIINLQNKVAKGHLTKPIEMAQKKKGLKSLRYPLLFLLSQK